MMVFTIVSIGMQESKEKSILHEKAILQTLEREPLNKCIEKAESDAESDRKDSIVLTYTIFSEAYKDCVKPTGHGASQDALIQSGKINLSEYCAPPTNQQVELERQKINAKEKLAKDECYKRYK